MIMKREKKNIYLIGFMGSGKSFVSDAMEKIYQKKKVEMDEEIQKAEGMSISEIFRKKGESYFRALETALLCRLGKENNLVISCGGGVPMREENVTEMKRNGSVILLQAEPKTVYERVKDCHDRPLLEGNMNISYIAEMMEKRSGRYKAAADFTIHTDGRPAEEICREILEKIAG